MRLARLAIFFLELELGEVFFFCTWVRLEPAFGGKGVGLLPAGQSSRRGSCTGTSPFN